MVVSRGRWQRVSRPADSTMIPWETPRRERGPTHNCTRRICLRHCARTPERPFAAERPSTTTGNWRNSNAHFQKKDTFLRPDQYSHPFPHAEAQRRWLKVQEGHRRKARSRKRSSLPYRNRGKLHNMRHRLASRGHRHRQNASVATVRHQPFDHSSTMQVWTPAPRSRPQRRAFCRWAFEGPGYCLVGGRKLLYLALLTLCPLILFSCASPRNTSPFQWDG